MKRIFAFLLLTALILSACAPVSAPTSVPATGVALLSTNTPVPTATFTSTPAPTATATATPTATSTVTPQPTATPNLANFQIEMWSSTSPNGEWKAQTVIALPVISDTTVTSYYYAQLKVSKMDGTAEWVIVDEWSEWGLGYTIPQPLHWSHDGRYLYITNKPVPDGCAVFVNGLDLHRVDLNNGSIREITPPVGLWLSLSPDETMLAYIGYGDRGLVIRDLATGAERETKLNPGEEYQAGHILWSPNGKTLILALALRPCSTDWADSTSIVRVDVATLEQVTLLQESKQLFVPVEWPTADKVLLKDKGGDYWLMNVTTGQITKK